MPCKIVVTGQNEQKKAHRDEMQIQQKVAFCGQKRAYPVGIYSK
jgi:hypothetical protein